MKTTSVLKLTSLLLLVLVVPTAFLHATNYTNNGGNGAYNLNSGDTLRIQQGTFNGVITNLPSGAVIIVAPNATFAPEVLNMWAPAGKIINNGTTTLGSMGIGGGFALENNKTFTVNGDMSFYSGAAKTLANNAGAQLKINGALSVNDNTTITNFGNISTTGSLSLYTASSILVNKGAIKVGGSFNHQGQVSNEAVINIAGDFNYWGGSLSNSGLIEPNGNFSIAAGLTYVNTCRLITKGGINNYGTLQNYGLVWAGTSGTATDQLTNSGSFINGAGAKVRTATFTNYGNITGAGYFYATGVTTLGSGATIGVSGTTSDSIKVYDVTRTNTNGIFDNQWGTVRPNTKYVSFVAPDSIEIFAGCSASFKALKGAVALPVSFNYFYLKTVDKKPVLYWSADFEENMKFEIERSFDGTHFSVIATATSNRSAAYTYSDANLGASSHAHYRIKGTSVRDGEIKYTATQSYKGDNTQKPGLSLYPNPAKGAINILYSALSPASVLVRIQTVNGQQMLLKNVSTVAGNNRISIAETANLPAGVYYADLIMGNEIVASEKFVKQ